MKMVKYFAAAAALIGLAACNGGGSDSGTGMGFAATGPTSGAAQAQAAVDDLQAVLDNQTAPTVLPRGTATFNGLGFWRRTTLQEVTANSDAFGNRLVNNPELLSDAQLTANFDANRVTSARFDNFRGVSGTAASGEITMGAAPINPVDKSFETENVSGTVAVNGQVISGSGGVFGAFVGNRAESVFGGVALQNNRAPNQALGGAFIANR